MEKLNLVVKRVNNTINGNPRYQILDWDNQSNFEKVLKDGFIRNLKKGYFTKGDHCECYGLENPNGIIINGINILVTKKY